MHKESFEELSLFTTYTMIFASKCRKMQIVAIPWTEFLSSSFEATQSL
jgi:hypothetical protein